MKRIEFNENYFENIDNESKSYYLGFIAADGSVVKNRWTLRIIINKKDIDILNRFIEEIKFKGNVWNDTKRLNMCQINLSSKKFIEDLSKYNIINNKTKVLNYPNLRKDMERHFLRGYFDGDGCINIKKDKRDGTERGCVTIVGGSFKMIESINNRMSYLFNINRNKIFGPKTKDYRYISWASMTDVERIYKGFYDDSMFYLERKKATFDKVIDIIKSKSKYRKK